MSEETKLLLLIGEYFDLGYAEGVEGRDADTMAGDAQRVLSEIQEAIFASNTLIEEQAARIDDLERERDAAIEAEDEAKDSFWAVYPTYCEVKGAGISTEAARTRLAVRATVAEARLSEAVKVLEELGTAVSIYRLGVKDTVPKIAAGDPRDMATINALMANNGILDAETSKAKAFIATIGENKK